jgi:hypothetical protein
MPSITSWTRLEPRSRDAEMETSVQARIYDPLWLLARQWQVGEFQGEDSGSPVMARLRAESARLTRYHPGAIAPNSMITAGKFDGNLAPLETQVEREPARPAAGGQTAKTEKLRFAAEAGLHFLRLLDQQPLAPNIRLIYRKAFLRKYPFSSLTPAERATLDRESLSFIDLMAQRAPDGRQLYAALKPAPGGRVTLAPDLQIAPADVAEVEKAAQIWLQWSDMLFSEPEAVNPSQHPPQPTWLAERMEYAFSVAARLSDGERTLTAQEYFEGHLDWHAFSVNAEVSMGAAEDNAITQITRTVIPAPVSFRGAPATRFWEFEDAQVDYSAIPTDKADLPRLLLIEFANSYGNDWFVLPIELEVGSLCRTHSLVVTDSFGVRTLVKPSSESGLPHSAWRMFQLSYQRPAGSASIGPASNLFFLPPTLVKNIEGKPIEEVLFLREEMANMAWGLERVIEGPAEEPLNRFDDYAERQVRRENAPPANERSAEVPVYRLATEVPDYWIPLLPTQTDPAIQAIRLLRGKMLKSDGTHHVIESRGRILNPDGAVGLALFEEEVPREGVRVTRNYQYTRWLDGSTHLWLGRRKAVGRGEGSIGLKFDMLES